MTAYEMLLTLISTLKHFPWEEQNVRWGRTERVQKKKLNQIGSVYETIFVMYIFHRGGRDRPNLPILSMIKHLGDKVHWRLFLHISVGFC